MLHRIEVERVIARLADERPGNLKDFVPIYRNVEPLWKWEMAEDQKKIEEVFEKARASVANNKKRGKTGHNKENGSRRHGATKTKAGETPHSPREYR